MSARILSFSKKALVRTRALSLEKQRKEQKTKAFVRTKLESKKEQQAQSVQEHTKAKSVRTAHAREAGSGTERYLKTGFRNDLKAAGSKWRAFALQLWSASHPDLHARTPSRPVADVWRYAEALLERIASGEFRSPPTIAQARREQMRQARRNASAKRHAEARRLADVTAMLVRGEYPGLG